MVTTCTAYHRLTSYDRYRMSGHTLDWSNQPVVFKDYPGLEVVPLPPAAPAEQRPGLLQLVASERAVPSIAAISLEQLSLVLALAYRLTARSRHAGGDFFYRSVPSAGALYPCELYLATRDLPGLSDGLYHYAIGRHGLVRLRSGNFLDSAAPHAQRDRTAPAPAVVFLVTAIFFRSAWKYRARSYRYHLLDSGHLLESLLLALKAASLPGKVSFDFSDQEVNAFLGCDVGQEGCLAMVAAGAEGNGLHREATAAAIRLPEAIQAASRVASQEVSYPALQEFHEASSRVVEAQLPVPDMIEAVGQSPVSWHPILAGEAQPEQMSFEEATGRRRSHRNFIPEPIPRSTFHALATLLSAPCPPSESRAFLPEQSIAPGFLVGNVQGLDSGCYWLDRSRLRLGLTRAGRFLPPMAHSCLDQEWLERAGLHCFVAANLEVLDSTWGPRGYRYAMLTAGRLGHRVYLGATAFGLGCCGIGAFYDEETASLLGLNPASVMLYLLAVGPVKRALR